MRPLQQYYLLMVVLRYCQNLSISAQGNVRSVVRQDGTVVESTDYYPYGTPFTTVNSVQPYKYGAKELDRMHGLDLYDSEARWYDSLLGRTTTMDPLAEKYYSLSPYTWCAGNLERNIDEPGNVVWRETKNHRSNSIKDSDAWDKLFKDPTKSKNYTKEQILNFRNEIETKIFGNSTGTIPDR